MAKAATDNSEQVVRNTGLMTLGTLLSRMTGLLRTLAMAYALGTTLVATSYQLANNLPNMVFELVAGGFISTAFLPVLLLQKEQLGQQGANRYTSNILNITLILLGGLSVLCSAFPDVLVFTQTFMNDVDSTVNAQATVFFRVFAYQILFYGLSGIVTGVLNAERSFLLTSVAPALNNLVVIASFIAFFLLAPTAYDAATGAEYFVAGAQFDLAIIVLAVGTTLGVAVQFAIQIPALVRTGFTWQPVLTLRDDAIAETLRIAGPCLIYIVASLVAVSARNVLCQVPAENGPSIIGYAWMWYQLPYGVVAVSLSSTLFTEMSDDVAKGDLGAFRGHVMRGVSGTLFLIIPLAGLLFALSVPLIELFCAGRFTPQDVIAVSGVLTWWVLSLPLYSVSMYLYKAFASLRKLTVFSLVNCALVAVQAGTYYVLCQPEVLGLYGIVAGDLVYYAIRTAVSFALLAHYSGRKRARLQESPHLGRTTVLTLVATVIGSALAYGLLMLLRFADATMAAIVGTIGWALIELCVCGLAGLVIIFGLCKLFHVAESELIDAIMRRLFGRFLPKRKDAAPAPELAHARHAAAALPAPSANTDVEARLARAKHARKE